jgi:Na+/H+-dicarboxylate symporter
VTDDIRPERGIRPLISRNLFATSDDPARLLIVLVTMMTAGLLLGQLLYDPAAVQAHGVVRLAGALGALFIWLLTFFMQPLVAASVYNAISTNSKSVTIAVSAIAIFAVTTASAVAWASVVGKWLIPGLGVRFAAPESADSASSLFDLFVAFLSKPFAAPWAEMDLLKLIAMMAMGALIVVATSERVKGAADEMFAPMAKLTVDWMLRVLRGLPPAVFFMSLSLAGTHGLGFLLDQVRVILMADVLAMGLHVLGIFLILTVVWRGAVITYMRHMSPAYVVAFGSSSSMGTLPTTMRSAERAGVPKPVADFIFPFGATVNMDGTCVGIMIRVMVVLEALGHSITWGDALMIGGTVMGASVATAAAPGASIALLRSVLITAAVATGVEGVSQDQVALVIVPFFAAFDFVSDRFRTLTNLVGDTFAAFVLTRLFRGKEAEAAEAS